VIGKGDPTGLCCYKKIVAIPSLSRGKGKKDLQAMKTTKWGGKKERPLSSLGA